MSEQNTEFERSVAIREGHKIHSETSYFTPRPQLDFENARHVFGEGFDRGYIAATAEANKRIVELECEVAELKEENQRIKSQIQYWKDFCDKVKKLDYNDYFKLQASNKRLREALETSDDLLRKLPNSGGFYGLAIMENNQLVLSATPAESLQAHDDEVIEKCAHQAKIYRANVSVIEAIRALKSTTAVITDTTEHATFNFGTVKIGRVE